MFKKDLPIKRVVIAGCRDYTDYKQAKEYIDLIRVMHPEANKGVAVRHLQELLGVQVQELYVCGDGTNDVQLLKSAFHSCAPADACSEVLSIARHILPPYREHAIANLIRQMEEGTL